MKHSIILAALLFLGCNCSTVQKRDAGNPYAYTGMSLAECRGICASMNYPPIGLDEKGKCRCDEDHCGNTKGYPPVGCEKCDPVEGCR